MTYLRLFLCYLSFLSIAQSQNCGDFHLFNFRDTTIQPSWQTPVPRAGFVFAMTYDTLTAPNTGYISFYITNQQGDTITDARFGQWGRYFPWTVQDTLEYVMLFDTTQSLTSLPANFSGYLRTQNPVCEIPFNTTILTTKSIDPSNDWQLYPNPSTGLLYLNSAIELQQLVIINALGQEVAHFSALKESTINVNFLPQGMYWLRIQNKNGNYSTKQFYKL